MINDSFYIDNIFDYIKKHWPELYNHIRTEEFRTRLYYRNRLVNIIQYEGNNTFDGIVRHIQKNEHMIDWWIL